MAVHAESLKFKSNSFKEIPTVAPMKIGKEEHMEIISIRANENILEIYPLLLLALSVVVMEDKQEGFW